MNKIILKNGDTTPTTDIISQGEVLVQHSNTVIDSALHTKSGGGELVTFPSTQWVSNEINTTFNKIDLDGFNNIVKELQNNKQYIITALNEKGVAASIDDTFMELANKITQIKEKEIITLPAETTNDFANTFFNIMMKSQGYDKMYETVWANYCGENGYVGALMTSLNKGTNTSIVLTGADAYYIYEEDKFYTIDENKNLVTVINGISTNLGIQSHLWDVENPNIIRTVFYLYKEGSIADGNRENIHTSAFDYCRDSNIPNIQYKSNSGNVMHFHVSNPDTCNLKWNGGNAINTRCYYFYTNVENANDQWTFYRNQNALTYVNFEALKKLTKGTLISESKVKKLDFPNLTEVTGGTLISKCDALESVDLSNLERITKTNSLIIGCQALKHISLPKLKFFETSVYDTGIIKDNNSIKEITFPSLETFKGLSYITPVYNCANVEKLYFPMIKNFSSGMGRYCAKINYVYLGCIGNRNDIINILQSTNNTGYDIELREGTKQIFTTNIILTAENIVNHIFKKLADNNFEDDGVTPAPAIKITIGSNNLANLTDEEKAIATDKNYILA